MVIEAEYRQAKNGYMVHRSDPHRYMHRDVWTAANGPIPSDHHIHHKNKDRTDNRLENLECIEKHAHMRLHGITFGQINSWAAKKARRSNERSLECWSCSKEFVTHHWRAKFCSHACAQKYNNWLDGLRTHVIRKEALKTISCRHCGTVFRQNRPFQHSCSLRCAANAGHRRYRARKALSGSKR